MYVIISKYISIIIRYLGFQFREFIISLTLMEYVYLEW